MKNYRRGKTTQLDWAYLSTLSTERDTWICVSERDKALISAGLVPLRWSTRYFNQDALLQLPDMIDELDAYMTMSETCCSSIVYCILNDTATQNAIRKIAGTTGNPTDNLGDGIIPDSGCDNDVLWGAVARWVDDLDRYIVDVFERIESATNFTELLATWLGGIPVAGNVLGLLPDLLDYIQETLAENYASAQTEALKNDMKCDLFCLYQEDCKLTGDEIYDYYLENVTFDLIPDNLEELIDQIVNGAFTGSGWVYAMNVLVMGFLTIGEDAVDRIPFINIPSLDTIRLSFALGANSPSSDWQIICDPCPTEENLNYLGGDGNATNPLFGVSWIGNSGRQPATAEYDPVTDTFPSEENPPPIGGEYITSLRVQFDVPSAWNSVDRIKAEYTTSVNQANYTEAFVITYRTNGTVIQTVNKEDGDPQEFDFTPLNGGDIAYFHIGVRSRSTGTYLPCSLDKLDVEGTS